MVPRPRRRSGSTASLDARRAAALGDLARTQTALDLFNQANQDKHRDGQQDDGVEARGVHPEEPRNKTTSLTKAVVSRLAEFIQRSRGTKHNKADEGSGFEARSARTSTTEGAGPDLPTAREVVLHAHFDAGITEQGVTVFGPTGRLEEGQRLLLLDQLRSWCTDSRTRITIKPVIDLNTDLSTTSYAIPDRIREQVILRDRTCVFPWCTRPARRCDIDHVVEFDHHAAAEGRPQPGPTASRPIWRRCAGSTTDSRPTVPGAIGWSNQAASSGPAPTATATDATTPAPSASSPTARVSRRTPERPPRPAPDPPPPIPRQRRP